MYMADRVTNRTSAFGKKFHDGESHNENDINFFIRFLFYT